MGDRTCVGVASHAEKDSATVERVVCILYCTVAIGEATIQYSSHKGKETTVS